MPDVASGEQLLDRGTLSFSVETRVLRELGERLVKQPEVAIVELIKNAYDADATECAVEYSPRSRIVVEDNGTGMTLDRFTNAWMRVGTASKAHTPYSERYRREITGEKGIGRFAVRFLGSVLYLESVANDVSRDLTTKLTAHFDWPSFDESEDLGEVRVPYQLVEARAGVRTGTKLVITGLRAQASGLDLDAVRTGSIGILTPLRSLFRQTAGRRGLEIEDATDPGFDLNVRSGRSGAASDVAEAILKTSVLRATLVVSDNGLDLRVYRRGSDKPYLQIVDTYANEVGGIEADIRFFPRRKGAFTGLPVDGRFAQTWIRENHGVAVFDRMFRVQPYGSARDDWLLLQADAARNRRDPRSRLAEKHFEMSQAVKVDTKQNWMLRLPQSMQLVGLVCVNGRRASVLDADGEGLIASADREGFLENRAFRQLRDLVRGAVEAIAFVDRQVQQEEEARELEEQLAAARAETKTAIEEIATNPHIAEEDKSRIISALVQSQTLVEKQGAESRAREQQLEVMSLLGVVAGFMTHEFGVALAELESTKQLLDALGEKRPRFAETAEAFAKHIKQLEEFVTYSSGYIRGARTVPKKPYPVMPRLRQVKRVFGKYAVERGIQVQLRVESGLEAPLVPVSLYNGLALNLFTNALKAVTAKTGDATAKIKFRAWNDERWHHLEVSDTGIGIPAVLRERVFDPLFTTTGSKNDPLGSGMGLGLTLVRRGAEAFGGRATVVPAGEGFATAVRIRLPLRPRGGEQ